MRFDIKEFFFRESGGFLLIKSLISVSLRMISNPFLPRAIPTQPSLDSKSPEGCSASRQVPSPTPPLNDMSAAGGCQWGSGTRNLSSESTGSNDSTGSFKRFNFYTDEEIRKMCTDGEPHRLRKILPEYFTEEKKVYLIGWMDRKMADIEVWLKEKRNAHPRKQAILQNRYDNIVVCHHYVSNLGKRSISIEK